ncbi:hypothetical protein AMC83_CH00294 [Rhizobium phaseoli]|nr:hypothetical protein AMC83_CH00294 [Rhizobium phaseoli]
MPDIRTLSAEEARAAIPALSQVLADCVAGGASVGFMQPYTPEDAEPGAKPCKSRFSTMGRICNARHLFRRS